MSQKKGRKKPRFNAIPVMVIEITQELGGRRTAKLQSARLNIGDLFTHMGLDLDQATRVKNLRHLQTFYPRHKVEVSIRGRSPKMVPLNRIRLDPENAVGDHPRLELVVKYGTLACTCTQPSSLDAQTL